LEVTKGSRTFQGIIFILVLATLLSSVTAAYYYSRYTQAEAENATYAQQLRQLGAKYVSHILFDFGNGTRIWSNDTEIQPGWSLYVATEVITGGHLNATYYPEYSSHLVTAIYNKGDAGNNYWGIWTFIPTNSSWQMAVVGSDELRVNNGSVFAWTYGPNSAPP